MDLKRNIKTEYIYIYILKRKALENFIKKACLLVAYFEMCHLKQKHLNRIALRETNALQQKK